MRSLIGKRWIWKAISQNLNDAMSNGRSFTTVTRFKGLNSNSSNNVLSRSPWSFSQQRGVKVLGTDVRVGNIVQRKGRVYQVLKAQHTQHGRGGASIQVYTCWCLAGPLCRIYWWQTLIIQVELREVDSGNKVIERFRTDEAIEKIYVEEKSFTYLYTEGDTLVLMDPKSFDQIEVSKDLLGRAAVYLKDDMKVTVQYFDDRPMSASVPQRVTCKVVEAQSPMKGVSATPQYKRVVLDNGLTVLAPPFIVIGDAIVINTEDDSYMTRTKE